MDEESLLLSGPASTHPVGEPYRLAMVHVWIPRSNPDGILAQNNWTLPFLRSGLSVHGAPSSAAARALSLAGVGEAFYEQLLQDGIGLRGAALLTATTAFHEAGVRAWEWRNARSPDTSVTSTEMGALEAVWLDLWVTLDATLAPSDLASMHVLRR